jgi:hypothetical protein
MLHRWRAFAGAVPTLVVAAMVAGCATGIVGGAEGPAIGSPAYRVGDRWVYRVVSGYRNPLAWDETHEVTAVGADGIDVRVTLKGDSVDIVRTEKLAAPGIVREGAVFEAETDRFDPPLMRYRFPLAPGEQWSQRVRDLDKEPTPYGPIQRVVHVGGYEKVSTPAGTFDAIRMRIFTRLDDETFWREATVCTYLVWYAPAVGATVREDKDAYYRDKGGYDAVAEHPAQYARVELQSFTRGP